MQDTSLEETYSGTFERAFGFGTNVRGAYDLTILTWSSMTDGLYCGSGDDIDWYICASVH